MIFVTNMFTSWQLLPLTSIWLIAHYIGNNNRIHSFVCICTKLNENWDTAALRWGLVSLKNEAWKGQSGKRSLYQDQKWNSVAQKTIRIFSSWSMENNYIAPPLLRLLYHTNNQKTQPPTRLYNLAFTKLIIFPIIFHFCSLPLVEIEENI